MPKGALGQFRLSWVEIYLSGCSLLAGYGLLPGKEQPSLSFWLLSCHPHVDQIAQQVKPDMRTLRDGKPRQKCANDFLQKIWPSTGLLL